MVASTPDYPLPTPPGVIEAVAVGMGTAEQSPAQPFSAEIIDGGEWFNTFLKIQKGELPRRAFEVGTAQVDDSLFHDISTVARVRGVSDATNVHLQLTTTFQYSDERLQTDGGYTPSSDLFKVGKKLRDDGVVVTFEQLRSGHQTMVLEKNLCCCRVDMGYALQPEAPDQPKERVNDPIKMDFVNLIDKSAVGEFGDKSVGQWSDYADMVGRFMRAFYSIHGEAVPDKPLHFKIPDWESYEDSSLALEYVELIAAPPPPSENHDVIGHLYTEKEKQAMMGFDQIGGNEEAIEEAKKLVRSIKFQEPYAKRGVTRPKGILLEGPPGTGKTLIAQAIAKEADTEFIALKISDILSNLYGNNEKNIEAVFRKAEAIANTGKDVIIFIDELDSFAPSRDSDIHEVSQKIISIMLQNINGFQDNPRLTIMGATNRFDKLDPAIIRSGRFDKKIHVGYPDEEGRQKILKIHLEKHSKRASAKHDLIDPRLFNELQDVARIIGEVSGADIATIVNLAFEKKVDAEVLYEWGDHENGKPWTPLTSADILEAKDKYLNKKKSTQLNGLLPQYKQ